MSLINYVGVCADEVFFFFLFFFSLSELNIMYLVHATFINYFLVQKF